MVENDIELTFKTLNIFFEAFLKFVNALVILEKESNLLTFIWILVGMSGRVDEVKHTCLLPTMWTMFIAWNADRKKVSYKNERITFQRQLHSCINNYIHSFQVNFVLVLNSYLSLRSHWTLDKTTHNRFDHLVNI